MKRSWVLLIAVAGVVLAADQWTKHWASRTLAFRPPIDVVGDLVRLTYTRNPGIAFGLGAGIRFPYYVFSLVAAVAILWLFTRHRNQSLARQLSLAMILGGALGNLIDRLSTGLVVDFIEVGLGRFHWPVFNVADSAVTIGVVLFALSWSRKEPLPQGEVAAGGPHESEGGALGPGDERGGEAGPLPREDAGRSLP